MYKINVKVESNKVSIISKTIPITTNSLNTIKCIFDLPQEYENLSCVAVFTCIDKVYKQMIIDNECVIPKDVLQYKTYVKLGVYAFEGEKLIYSPETAGFNVVIGSYTEENEEETEFTQTAFDKMVEKTNELYLKIEKSNEDLDTKMSEIDEKIKNGELKGQDDIKYLSKFEGNTIINNSTDNCFADISIVGVIEQEGQPLIENPSQIHGLGGTNVEIKIKNEKEEQNFNLRMQNVELFADEEIYEEDGKFYYNKQWHKVILDGSNEDGNWIQENAANGFRYYCYNNIRPQVQDLNSTQNVLCDRLPSKTGNQTWVGEQGISGGGYHIQVRLNDFNANKTLNEFKEFLSKNPLTVVYKMKAPIKTEIIDEDFISDLRNLKSAKTYYPKTEISLNSYGKLIGTYVSTNIYGKVNLYAKDEIVEGELYNPYGKVEKYNTVARTPLIDISKFNKISVKTIGGGHYYTFFDETKKFISGFSNSSKNVSFYIPQGANYFSAALYANEIDTFEIKTQYDNKVITSLDYIGKTMNCLGDSITYGYIPGSGRNSDGKTIS